MKTDIKTICFFFPHGIGDVVMATPIVIGLKKKYPAAHLTMITRTKIEGQLFGGESDVHDRIAWDIGKKHSLKEKIQFMWRLRRRKFDLLVFDHGIDNIKAAIFSKIIAPRISVGEKGSVFSRLFTLRTNPDYSVHKVTNNWKMLQVLGIHDFADPYVHTEDCDFQVVHSLLKSHSIIPGHFLVIHPGSSAPEFHKRWPVSKYKSFLRQMTGKVNLPVILVGGGDEKDLCNEIGAPYFESGSVVNFAGFLSIKQLAALLSSAHLVIGNDSGVMHIASAVGARTLSVFGPTPHLWSGPFRKNRVVTLSLPCSPCYLEKRFGCGNPICLTNLSENLVLKELDSLIDGKYSHSTMAV
jgi:ADP-heptose:LPS heptosyltransferase